MGRSINAPAEKLPGDNKNISIQGMKCTQPYAIE